VRREKNVPKVELPKEFWSLPGWMKNVSVDGMKASELHKRIIAQLKEDANVKTGFGTVESMMLERAATFYMHVRVREMAGAGSNPVDRSGPGAYAEDKDYKDALTVLNSMLSTVQKAGAAAPTADDVKLAVALEIRDRMFAMVETLEQDWQATVRERIVMEFDGVQL
jgi:hypothetical protein